MTKLKTLYLPFSISESTKNACTFPLLLSNSHRQSLPLTLSHPDFSYPIHSVRCVPSVCVIAKTENQQKLDDKVDNCECSVGGIFYAFLQDEC